MILQALTIIHTLISLIAIFTGCYSPGFDWRCPYGVDLGQSPSPASPDLMSAAKPSPGFDEPTIIKNAKLIVYKGAPHGMPSTSLTRRLNHSILHLEGGTDDRLLLMIKRFPKNQKLKGT